MKKEMRFFTSNETGSGLPVVEGMNGAVPGLKEQSNIQPPPMISREPERPFRSSR